MNFKNKKWLYSTALLSILAIQGTTASASHIHRYATEPDYESVNVHSDNVASVDGMFLAQNPSISWNDFWGGDFWGHHKGAYRSYNASANNVAILGNNNGGTYNYTSNTGTTETGTNTDTSNSDQTQDTSNSQATSQNTSKSDAYYESTSSANTSSNSSATIKINTNTTNQTVNTKTYQSEGYGNKTTGGDNATTQNTIYVDSFSSLKAALKASINGPRKIIITRNIDGNNGQTASDYAKDTNYNFNQYLKDYNPSTYGYKKPSGNQETNRAKAQANQGKNVKFEVPSNTTITSVKGAKLSNINFIINSNNVILQNLNMTAPVDDFPQWDGTDGKTGNWNSQYDAVSIKGGTNVWITHSRFGDGATNDENAPTYYNRQYQQHDGLVDITDGSDYITTDYNIFENHDKTMLIGSSDNNTNDENKLHVTVANNYFHNTTQRGPRVRYGTVNIINNYYQSENKNPYPFAYAIGAGYKSNILAENNVVEARNTNTDKFISNDGQHEFSNVGNVFNGHALTTNIDNNVNVSNNVPIQNIENVKTNVLQYVGPKF